MIGVLGAGTMGLGIIQTLAQSGMEVTFVEQNQELVDKGLNNLDKKLEKLVAKEKITSSQKEAIFSRVKGAADIAALEYASIVIEAATENTAIKKAMFQELDEVCRAETILASNTSALSITEIAAATNRPDKVIGMHFFNPVPAMKLVEVINGLSTSQETTAAITKLAEEMGKSPVQVEEAPGFVVNRILIPMINEAIGIRADGVADTEGIDKAMQLGANFPMGPLALGDLIGLDVCLAIMDTIYNETHDSKYRASLLMRKLVRAGHLGRKTGKGFFDYSK